MEDKLLGTTTKKGTKKVNFEFNNKAKEKLLQQFPTDMVLR
jgi:hypothetical protein